MVLQVAVLLTLFALLPEIYGFIFLSWIAAQMCLSVIFSNAAPLGKSHPLYLILCAFSCWFPFFLQFIVLAERKNIISRSVALKVLLGVYALLVCGLMDVWLCLHLRFFAWLSVANGILTLAILLRKREVHGKIFWIILIFALPGTGMLLYLFSCRGIYFFTFRARCRRFDRENGNLLKDGETACTEEISALLQPPDPSREPLSCPQYFCTGAALFEDVLQKLQAAEKFIYLEFFIYGEGELTDKLFGILDGKAAEGVDVYVIYDELGGIECLNSKRFAASARAGVRLCAFNPLTPFLNPNMNFRDHRKIVVIDGKTAYTGGINLADEYAAPQHVRGAWKDCGVRLGHGAEDMAYLFERTWFALTGEKLSFRLPKVRGDAPCITFGDGLEYRKNVCKEVYLNLIRGAQQRLKIMTPYFMPGRQIVKALAEAAGRGVDVTLCLPYVPDRFYVHLVTRLNAEKCLKYGIKVKYMHSGFLHSKVVLCDDTVCICTANFDYRSLYMQQECGIVSNDGTFLGEVNEDFTRLEEDCIIADDTNRLSKHKFKTCLAYLYNLIAYWF